MTKGIDCAVPLTAQKASLFATDGYEFVCRYIVSGGWKALTRDEVEVIKAAGLKIISVFQKLGGQASMTAHNGAKEGREAYQVAKSLGQPADSAIYFAVDYDAQPRDYDAIEAYLRAAAGQISGYHIGVYGSYTVVTEMAKRIPGINVWQTYAWSGGKKAQANIYQHRNDIVLHGHQVDVNESYGGEGWWGEVLSKEDANKIIPFLSAAYMATEDPEARKEFNRLANELRKASGQPTQ